MEFEKKSEVIQKIVELAAILHVTGELTQDGQSQFIAEMVMTVLTASQDQNHARLLHNNVGNFIKEVYVMEGKKSVTEFMKEKTICQN